jgi:hypothetical protein
VSKKVPRQKVIIELSNGKKGVFEGVAIAWPDEVHDVLVTNVTFVVPTTANPKNVTPEPAAKPAETPPKEAPKDPPKQKEEKKAKQA